MPITKFRELIYTYGVCVKVQIISLFFCEYIQIINIIYVVYNKNINLLQNVTFIIDVYYSLGYNISDVRIR